MYEEGEKNKSEPLGRAAVPVEVKGVKERRDKHKVK